MVDYVNRLEDAVVEMLEWIAKHEKDPEQRLNLIQPLFNNLAKQKINYLLELAGLVYEGTPAWAGVYTGEEAWRIAKEMQESEYDEEKRKMLFEDYIKQLYAEGIWSGFTII